MEENDYKSVVNDLKLANGLIFGLPVVFDTDDVRVVPGATVLLQYKNVPIAVFHVSYEDFITCFTCWSRSKISEIYISEHLFPERLLWDHRLFIRSHSPRCKRIDPRDSIWYFIIIFQSSYLHHLLLVSLFMTCTYLLHPRFPQDIPPTRLLRLRSAMGHPPLSTPLSPWSPPVHTCLVYDILYGSNLFHSFIYCLIFHLPRALHFPDHYLKSPMYAFR